MKWVFVDTNVFFSACYSQTGASFEIFRLALSGVIGLVTSEYVLEETRRNLAKKSPQALASFLSFLELINFETANASKEEVLEAAQYTELKDAPVVAAARHAAADYLVTLDRRHLLNQPHVEQQSGLRIILPETLLEIIRTG